MFQENADVEWKFASTSMWLAYLQTGDVVPAPFNLLPSWVDMKKAAKYLYGLCHKEQGSEKEQRLKNLSMIDGMKVFFF